MGKGQGAKCKGYMVRHGNGTVCRFAIVDSRPTDDNIASGRTLPNHKEPQIGPPL